MHSKTRLADSVVFDRLFTGLLVISVVVANGSAEGQQVDRDWVQFLGNSGNSTAPEDVNLPVEWEAANVRWEADIPGKGWSSPVFSDGQIWLTTAISHTSTAEPSPSGPAAPSGDSTRKGKSSVTALELRAICVDSKSGQILHNILLDEVAQPAPINPLNSHASPTPAIQGNRVVCHFGSYGTWCLNTKTGDVLWNAQYVIDHGVGPGSSPIIYQDLTILVCDGVDRQFIVALEIESGKEAWLSSRPPMRGDDGDVHKSYCTPLVAEINGTPQLIVPSAQWIASYAPNTGEELWRAEHGSGFSLVSMPVHINGLIVFSTGYMQPEFVAVDPSGSGDVTTSHIKWRSKNAPNTPSFVQFEGNLYSISDRGILSCLNGTTGESIVTRRLGGNYSATPLLAGGKLYICSREGIISVIDLADEMSVVATHEMNDGMMASPAVIESDLLIRTERKLYRIGDSQSSGQ